MAKPIMSQSMTSLSCFFVPLMFLAHKSKSDGAFFYISLQDIMIFNVITEVKRIYINFGFVFYILLVHNKCKTRLIVEFFLQLPWFASALFPFIAKMNLVFLELFLIYHQSLLLKINLWISLSVLLCGIHPRLQDRGRDSALIEMLLFL